VSPTKEKARKQKSRLGEPMRLFGEAGKAD
jgi:hypothetical protein